MRWVVPYRVPDAVPRSDFGDRLPGGSSPVARADSHRSVRSMRKQRRATWFRNQIPDQTSNCFCSQSPRGHKLTCAATLMIPFMWSCSSVGTCCGRGHKEQAVEKHLQREIALSWNLRGAVEDGIQGCRGMNDHGHDGATENVY